MYAVCVTFTLAPDAMSRFLPLVTDNAGTSLRDEPGCHRFDIATDAERPAQLFLYELYDDRAAFDAHLASDHYKAFDMATGELVADKSVATWSEMRA